MFEPTYGVLPEVFDADWKPEMRTSAPLWEAGHHSWWVLLLDWYSRLRFATRLPLVDRLFESAFIRGCVAQWGVADFGGTLRAPDRATCRSWPQTEFLKGGVAFGLRRGGLEASDDSLNFPLHSLNIPFSAYCALSYPLLA